MPGLLNSTVGLMTRATWVEVHSWQMLIDRSKRIMNVESLQLYCANGATK
jgi:hypothetical protein